MQAISDALESAFRSERLEYRALDSSEESRRLRHQLNQPAIAGLANTQLLRPKSEADTAAEIEQMAKSQLLVVSICLPAAAAGGGGPAGGEPTPIGVLNLRKSDEASQHHRATSIGIRIAAPYQNKGYGGEAINWALDWAFKWANMHRVEIEAMSCNERAAALYRKLGFVPEGTRRQVTFANGQWHDHYVLAMLEDEWRALRASSPRLVTIQRQA